MSKKPFNPVIPDYTPKAKKQEEEVKLNFQSCCVCHVVISQGYYGRWGDGGTCSKSCEATREDMQLYLKEVP